jgi:hypothetical protein
MIFHLINVVWGEAYTKLLLDICIPTQLADGNLSAFRDYSAVYKIYTTAKDAKTIVNHPTYLTLSKTINTKIKIFDVPDVYMKHNQHHLMNYCHNHAIVEATQNNAIMILLCPDSAWPNQTFANIIKLAKKQKRVVVVPSLSVVTETFVPSFLQHFNSNQQTIISISPRQLVKISLEHLHPFVKSYFWNNGGLSNIWPSYFYWNVEGTGLIHRCFRMHPLMINPEVKNVLSPDPIDSQYLSLACPNLRDFYVGEDSDEFFTINMVRLDKEDLNANILQNGQKSGIEKSVNWLKQYKGSHVQPCHQLFFEHKVKIHSQPLSNKWNKIEQESDKIVNMIIKEAKK